MSSGPSASPPNSPSSPQRPAPEQRPTLRLSRLLIWAMILMIVGPCAFRQAPLEVSRWHVARAIQRRQAGNKEAAWAALDRAMAWDADSPVLLLRRARWHKADGDYEAALADLLKADQLLPDNYVILAQRAEALQFLKRHAEAIEIWKGIDRLSTAGGSPPRAIAQNGLAYARSLAKMELDEALTGINQALQADPQSPAMLDTRGFILYQQGKYDEAIEDLEPAVQGVEHELRKAMARPETIERAIDYSELSEGVLAELRQATAVIRYHRGLAYEKVGRHAEAKADMARAKVLAGREPDETLF